MKKLIRATMIIAFTIIAVLIIQSDVVKAVDVAKDPRAVPRSPLGDVTVNLDAVEVVAELAPGKSAWVWTFALKGGKPTVPGPMVRVREGNHVTINLCNLGGEH